MNDIFKFIGYLLLGQIIAMSVQKGIYIFAVMGMLSAACMCTAFILSKK